MSQIRNRTPNFWVKGAKTENSPGASAPRQIQRRRYKFKLKKLSLLLALGKMNLKENEIRIVSKP
jgi:hypothetical protein